MQRTTQQKYAQPRHQPSDRDQKAQQSLKAKTARAQICIKSHNTSGSIKPAPIVTPPHPQNNYAYHATQQLPLLDPTDTSVTLELDLCVAFHSLNIHQTDEH